MISPISSSTSRILQVELLPCKKIAISCPSSSSVKMLTIVSPLYFRANYSFTMFPYRSRATSDMKTSFTHPHFSLKGRHRLTILCKRTIARNSLLISGSFGLLQFLAVTPKAESLSRRLHPFWNALSLIVHLFLSLLNILRCNPFVFRELIALRCLKANGKRNGVKIGSFRCPLSLVPPIA
jgi:hypothetical protein